MENMKKFVYIGVEKDYDERDFQEVYDGLIGSTRTAVYFDPETRKVYHENFWGELVPVEFPNRITVIYNGSSEHVPQFVHLIVKDEPETEESDGFWYNQES